MSVCFKCDQILERPGATTAIGCDDCPAWYHSECLSLNKLDVKALTSQSCSLVWRCDDCRTRSKNESTSSTDTIIAQNSVDSIAINNKLDTILKALELNHNRLSNIENQINARDAKIDDLAQQCEHTAAKLAETNNKVDSEILALRGEIESCVSAMPGLSNQCSSCTEVNDRVENIERHNLMSNLVLDGLPLLVNDNHRENLFDVVIAIGRHVAVNVKREDVEKIYRTPARPGINSSKCRPVIIHFRDRSIRDQIYHAYLKNHNLMLSDIIPEHQIKSRIYLSEHITAQCKLLLRRCAVLKKKKVITRYFTRNGKLFCAINSNDSPILATPHLIDDLED